MDENSGQVFIQVGVLSGTLQREVVVNFSTSDSTAIGTPKIKLCVMPNCTLAHAISDGNDYIQVQSRLLTIINNNVYELTETFNGILSFPGDPVPRVALSPNATEVTILDDDG